MLKGMTPLLSAELVRNKTELEQMRVQRQVELESPVYFPMKLFGPPVMDVNRVDTRCLNLSGPSDLIRPGHGL